MKIINKVIAFSYILFAISLVILYINKVAALMILAASFFAFLISGLFSARNNSINQNNENKREV